ncbi:MAG TPA: murein L,D-transpeptidase catalytic domain family protein [Chitinophagaceae bacterium]|nr:murein L,D-transpeptidase catalytic domain family protein [Chitinophagaceae bacterium]
MKFVRLSPFFVIIIIAASWLSKTGAWKNNKAVVSPEETIKQPLHVSADNKLKERAASVKSFLLRKGYNNEICFFIDMSLPSGQNRFFIYDLQKDSLRSRGLVAHGNCFENWLEGRKYSNTVGSGCTSLGKYRIGIHYYGKFGYSYKLHGLDNSNNNAFERTVVLHAHSCIPETEIGEEICQSNGCPTVSPGFLEQLKKIINASKKPVMLWVYD